MELLSLVNQIVVQNNIADVLECPQKEGNCINKFHCGQDCQPAQSAHEVFRVAMPGATTENYGEHGMLTA